AWGVNVQRDIPRWILCRQQEDLCAQLIRDLVVHLAAEENDALAQKAVVNVTVVAGPSSWGSHLEVFAHECVNSYVLLNKGSSSSMSPDYPRISVTPLLFAISVCRV